MQTKHTLSFLRAVDRGFHSWLKKNMPSSTANLHKRAYCMSTMALKGIFQVSLSPLFLNGNEIQVELDSNLLNGKIFLQLF